LREAASSGTLNPSILYHTFENIFLTANPKTASPVQQHITLAVLMYKVRSMSTPVYYMTESQKVSTAELYVHLRSRCWSNRSLGHFSGRAFLFSALYVPSVWGLLPQTVLIQTVLISDSLSVFKSRLKTFLFSHAFAEHWFDLPPGSVSR